LGPVGVPIGILGPLAGEALVERGGGDFEILLSILGPLGSERCKKPAVGDWDFESKIGSSWQLWKLEEESVLAWRGAFAAELMGLVAYLLSVIQTAVQFLDHVELEEKE